ncbi:unnamed protein product [Bemisia tabaci]|uniref:Uncharacterized protein n=1 Tax=Bemisia tabaci TaxID=7038 RepID=A0A9P0A9K7_BEMTA|nr:unnamed protein product [Bemisia tabaci]
MKMSKGSIETGAHLTADEDEQGKYRDRTRDSCGPSPFLPAELIPSGRRRSPVTQTLIEHDILEFGSISTARPVDSNLDKAIAHARRCFALPNKVKPYTFSEILDSDLDIWNKSPGLPWSTMRDADNKPVFKTKRSVVQNIPSLNYLRRQNSKVKYGEPNSPPDCQAFVWGHICDVNELFRKRAVEDGYDIDSSDYKTRANKVHSYIGKKISTLLRSSKKKMDCS